MNVYPFTLHPHEYRSGHTESPRLALNIWRRIRKTDPDLEDRPWYAVGVDVTEGALELHIYRMRDNLYGGLGHLEFAVPVKRGDLTADEQTQLLVEEQRETLVVAEREIERQDNEAYKQRRQTVAQALFPHLFSIIQP